ncbi:MAG TPA: periplasmic heavy metal sensor [Thermoanaerobaculia bacterium]
MKRGSLAALVLLVGTLGLHAQDWDGKWWKNSRLAQEIALTSEQADRIEKVFVQSRPALIDLRADLEKKQFFLQQAMEEQSVPRGELESKMEAVEDARAALQKARQRMLLDIRQVLKPEQWQKLVQKRQEMRLRVMEQRREMKDARPPARKPAQK